MTERATGDGRRATGRRGLRIAVALLPFLTGCTGSLLESDLPPSTSYVLAPAPPATDAVAVTRADLSIGRPEVAPGLDTDRIAVLEGRRLDYYRGAKWGARAADVVHSMLVDSLQDQGLFRSVTPDRVRVSGDYVLDVEVRDFQAEYGGDGKAPAAHVTTVCRLIRIADRQLVDTIVAEARTRASDNRMHAVVAAFESAAQQVALQVAKQAAAAVAADEQASRNAEK